MAHIPNRIYRVPNIPENANIPHDGIISFSDFYGGIGIVEVTYELIGGGGEGAGGYLGGNGAAGGTSSFSGEQFDTVTAAGGAGGTGRGAFNGQWTVGEAGEASYYGPGGRGGINSDSFRQTPGYPAPASSYGAGGGGGGAHPFSAQNGGDGGYAATRVTGTFNAIISTDIVITIGSGGSAISGGGNGASGYCKFTIGNNSYEFVSSTTFTVPIAT